MIAAILCVALSTASSTYAQNRLLNRQTAVSAENPVNLFVEIQDGTSYDGAILTAPPGWKLVQVRLLRNGRDAAVSWSDDEMGGYLLRYDGLDDGSSRLVVQMRVSDEPSGGPITYIPVKLDPAGNGRTLLSPLTADVTVENRVIDPSNMAGVFDARSTLEFDTDILPPFDGDGSFTIEFWIKTLGLDQVVMSGWNGDEDSAYPAELVTAPDGRLLFFRGEPGRHLAMSSDAPVADGLWHHVAISHDEIRGWSRLLVDAVAEDSLFGADRAVYSPRSRFCVGGRCGEDTAIRPGRFSGYLDDLRIWPTARTSEQIASTMVERLPPIAGLVSMTFDGDGAPPPYLVGSDNVVREASDFVYFDPVERLRLSHEESGVTIHWASRGRSTREFVVERSDDGVYFEPIETYTPDDGSVGEFVHFDAAPSSGVTYYRIRQVLEHGGTRYSAIIKVGLGNEDLPAAGAGTLLGNFPNPFSSSTTISFEIAEPQHVTVSVWDLAGQQVVSLLDAAVSSGRHEVVFVPEDLPSGTYFARLQTDSGISTRKIIFAK